MKTTAHIQAYDCLDQVVYACQVKQTAEYETGPLEPVVLVAGVLQGEGITHPREWLRDVLVGILELL